MLRIKYFEEFKNDAPFLVILGDEEGLHKAYDFFVHREEAYLDDTSIVQFSEIAPLQREALYLNRVECQEIAQHFKSLSEAQSPCHLYFDTQALGDIEVLISYGEYNGLF